MSGVGRTGARLGPRVVPPTDKDQVAVQLAASLTEAVARFLIEAERQVATHANRIRASTLDDLERQRTSVESLISLFAERLQRQEEGLSSQQRVIAELSKRLDRHAEELRSSHEARAREAALLSQSLEILRRLAATGGGPPAGPPGPAGP